MWVPSLIVDSVLFAPRGFHFTHEVKEKVSELGVGESAELFFSTFLFKDINLLSDIDKRATNVDKCAQGFNSEGLPKE